LEKIMVTMGDTVHPDNLGLGDRTENVYAPLLIIYYFLTTLLPAHVVHKLIITIENFHGCRTCGSCIIPEMKGMKVLIYTQAS
jgi:hypothetical protein